MAFKSIQWDRRRITKPGCYAGIPIDNYHSHDICDGPSASSSMLRALNPEIGSPAHMYAKWSGNPNYQPSNTEKRHFILGRALHHLVLGEKFFKETFIIQPAEYTDAKTGEVKPWNNNANVCKAWHAEHPTKSVLTHDEAQRLLKMATSLGNHPLVKMGIFRGQIERSIFWKDRETGIWLKWRPDCIPMDAPDFGELKSTHSIQFGNLRKSVREFGYYQQTALGAEACREVLNMDMGEFRFIFVESNEPHCTADFAIEDDDIRRGTKLNRQMIRLFARCVEANRWPGPYDGREGQAKIGLADTARQSIDARLERDAENHPS